MRPETRFVRDTVLVFVAAVAAYWAFAARDSASADTRGNVVFDVDLTSGHAGIGKVTGGAWDRGWKATGAQRERIVFDAGRPIANGLLEVTLALDPAHASHGNESSNVAGIYEHSMLDQRTREGDVFYARTGIASGHFAQVIAAGRRLDGTEHEVLSGTATDGGAPKTIRFEWRDGVPIFTGLDAKATVFPRDVIGGDKPMDRLRYAFIGSDDVTRLTTPGLRYTRVKLVDYGVDVEGPPPEPLHVHSSGRVLETASGRPVFVLGDTAWSLVARLTREEIDAYLRHRREQRFNAVTFVLFSPNTPALAASQDNAYGDPPFRETNGQPDPGRPATTEGARPTDTTEYDYWDHVDYAIAQCRRLGLYAIVLPTWGSGVTAGYSGEKPEEIVFDAPKAYAYGHWLGARYGSERHVIWMLGGDRSAIYEQRDYRPVFRAMAEGLADGARGDGTFDSRADYSGLLLSYHPRKDAPNSSEWFHDDEWLSFNSIQDWPEIQIQAIESDWQRTPAKPTWLYEGRYEGYFKRGYRPDQWGEWQTRLQAWQPVLAGGFGHTYGHERVFSFGVDGADWKAFLDAPGAKSMTHLARLMNSLKHGVLARLRPDPTLVAGEAGAAERIRSTRIVASRSDTGLALFYSPNGRTVNVAMNRLPNGPLHGFWFNPRTGGWHASGSESSAMRPFATDIAGGPGAAVRPFDPPGAERDGDDWLLVLSPNPTLR